VASAEQLLHEAQFAFQNISFGESRDNRRNTSRAISLAKKIIRKYPVSMEAGEAHAILRRLGDESYSLVLGKKHKHPLADSPAGHVSLPKTQHSHQFSQSRSKLSHRTAPHEPDDGLDLGQLLLKLISLPRFIQVALVAGGFFLFSIMGPFLLLPLAVIVIFATPLRKFAPVEMRREVAAFVRSVNEWIADGKTKSP